jgi:hypothetical protein
MNEVITVDERRVFEEHSSEVPERSEQEKEWKLPSNYQFFMCHINHEHFDYLEQTLLEYEIGEYVIGAEITPNTGIHHFHFLVEMSKYDYAKFSKRVFIQKFQLRGRATKGAPRQYGKVKDIQSLDKAAAYSIKDGNIRTNMSQTRIDKLAELAYEKKTDDITAKLIEYVDDNILGHHDYDDDLVKGQLIPTLIIGWLRTHKKPLRASTIRYYSHQVFAYTKHQSIKWNDRELYHTMFPHGI